jgi:hypothetical protein
MDNYSGVSLSDYANLNSGQAFSGDYQEQDVAMLYKAMSAGQITGRETTDSTTASGAPLKVESLENTLKILTNTPKHTPLFYKIGKKPATNTIEEYNQLVSYGGLEGGSLLEGELPSASDSVYRRKAQHIKYHGVMGAVTHPMQLVQTGSGVANMTAQETKNKVMKLTQILEGKLPFADSRKIATNFNGFFAQQETEGGWASMDQYQDSEVVVDLRGSVLTDTAIEKASLGIVDNFGLADLLISSPRTLSNFVTRYHSKKLIMPVPEQVRDGVFGQRVNEIITQNGPVETLQSNFFKYSTRRRTADPATDTKAPSAPVADPTTPAAGAADALNRFASFEGDYYYAVSAKNRFGESAIVPLGTALVTVAAGQSVDLKFTAGTGSPEQAECYCIYRSKINPVGTIQQTDLYKVFEVSVQELANGYDGAAATFVRDRNRFLPDGDQAMLIEWDADQVVAWKQLAPMMKMNLAIISPEMRFMVLCYGTVILYAPRKMVRFINIGDSLAGL